MKNKKGKNLIKYFILFILSGFIIKSVKSFFIENSKKIKSNFNNFLCQERKEVKKFSRGKKPLKKFLGDSCAIFNDFFIPTECNGYKPKILRKKSLAIIIFSLFFLKIFVISYLFLIYPNAARMSETISGGIFNLINKEREKNNLGILSQNEILNKAAKNKAEDMVKNNYFAHRGLDGKMPWEWINRGEYAYLYAGENLAMNFTSAFSAHKALMLSESHKRNILNNRYADIGIAVVSGKIDGEETNVLVELFASPKPSSGKDIAKNTVPTKAGKNIKEIKTGLNEGLDKHILVSGAELKPESMKNSDLFTKLIYYSEIVFLAALIILIVLLLLNILIKISVQHKAVIIQTLLVILLVIGLISTKIHFIEDFSEKIRIF